MRYSKVHLIHSAKSSAATNEGVLKLSNALQKKILRRASKRSII